MKVSCVIPTHKREVLLEEALESVLAQTLTAAEIIVVDDADDPETAQVVNRRRGNGVEIVLVQNSDRGASSSRNLGARHATGDLIAFLDDDDLWDPTYLEKVVPSLSAERAVMGVAWLDVLGVDGVRRPLLQMPDSVSPATAAGWNQGFTGSNFIVTKDAFDSLGGFDADLPVSNDKDFLVRFLLAGHRYIVVPAGLVVHRRHGGPQLTAADRKRADGMALYIAKHHGVLSRRGRRSILRTIHAIKWRDRSRGRLSRLGHFAGWVLRTGLVDLQLLRHRRMLEKGSK